MRKVFFFAAALVAMVACNKSESSISVSNPEEIGFFTMTQNSTRGYIMGESFYESSNPDSYQHLKDASDKYHSTVQRDSSWRIMVVSAFNATDETDYFKGVDFKADTAITSVNLDKAIWHSSPRMYWPIGKDLEFLTFSQNNIAKRNNAVAKWDGAKKVSFDITPEMCYQNDIVYAQAKGSNRGTADETSSSQKTGLAIKFYHSQAWLTFNVTAVGEDRAFNDVRDSAVIQVDKIVLENVYNSGVLSFEYDTKTADLDPYQRKPIAKWDFFTQNPTDVEVDDPHNVLDTVATTGSKFKGGRVFEDTYAKNNVDADKKLYNGFQLNMLMPAQKHNNFVLYYTINGKQNSIVLPFEKGTDSFEKSGFSTDDAKKWEMGKHYIYNITIEINELTFAPTVKAWVDVTGFNPVTQDL